MHSYDCLGVTTDTSSKNFFLSTELMFVICWLLHPDPKWRATIQDLETNDWINQPVEITKYDFEAVLGEQFLFIPGSFLLKIKHSYAT